MYARVTRFQFDPARRQEAIDISDDELIAGLRQEQEFEHIYILAGHDGSGMVVTLWSSETGEQASRASVAQRFAILGDIVTAPPPPSEVYEVVTNA